jgi:cohesin complex subunit SCC1
LQAFRLSGNNDIPAGLHMPSRDALMLPDVLTEGDNLEMPPMPDASFLLSQMDDDSHLHRKRRAGSRDINLQDDLHGSQFLQNSIENRNLDEEELALDPMDDIDLELDFAPDLDDWNVGGKNERSIEIGRDAPAARAVEDDLLSELDVQVPSKENLNRDDRDMSLNLGFGGDDGVRMADDDGNVDMFDNIGDQPDVSALPAAPIIDRARISESPLSDVDEADVVEGQHNFNKTSLYEQPGDDTEQSVFRNPAQRARRQKVLQMDAEIELTNTKIKEQQHNRDKITKPQSFLPRDPELLALIEMQKNGGFISNIMNDGRSSGWAPELQGMLSLATIRKAGDLKRKRDSSIADMDGEDEGPNKSPRLELGEDEEDLAVGVGDAGLGRDNTVNADGTMMEIPGEDGFMMPQDDDHDATAGLVESPGPNFDETTAPLVHPADSGPVSLGTKHAVHLLRDRFGPEAADSPDKRKKACVLFQDLLPEATTSKVDATKMFFEVLVLATKDAVKVEQQEALLGGPIRVRGKRGLWGDWAEREAGGEIEEEANAAPNGLESVPAIVAAA